MKREVVLTFAVETNLDKPGIEKALESPDLRDRVGELLQASGIELTRVWILGESQTAVPDDEEWFPVSNNALTTGPADEDNRF